MGIKSQVGLGLLGLLMLSAAPIETVPAQTLTPVKFALNWAFEGSAVMWTMAQSSGCYAREGVDLTLDRGFGSGDTATKVAAGAYDVGQIDFSTMVQFDAQNPQKKLIAFFMEDDAAPMSVQVLKSSGITKPQDLAGKSIADTVGEASRVMFPVFAKANGLDPQSVNWISVAPALRQQLLVQKRTDAIAGHIYTIATGLHALGVKDEDVTVLRYRDYGVNFYGNALAATSAWLEAHPKEARAIVRCSVQGIKAELSDGKAAIASVKARNPLINDAAETASMDFMNNFSIDTAGAKKNGLSAVDRTRLGQTLQQASSAMGVATPNLDDVWTDKYLPPHKELALD